MRVEFSPAGRLIVSSNREMSQCSTVMTEDASDTHFLLRYPENIGPIHEYARHKVINSTGGSSTVEKLVVQIKLPL